MRVLVACEYSGRVREAFRKLGHETWSCDILESEDSSPFHIQGDALAVIAEGVGFNDRSSTLYASSRQRGETLRSQASRRETASSHRILHEAGECPNPSHRYRESGMHHVDSVAQAQSDNSAVDVWTRRDESNVLMVERATKLGSDEHRRRTRATDSQAASRAEQVERTEQNLLWNCGSNGIAVGESLTMARKRTETALPGPREPWETGEPWQHHPTIWKSEAAFWAYLRGGLRLIWSRYPPKLAWKKAQMQPPPEGYTGRAKSMGRCVYCNELFAASHLEVDHVSQAGSMNSWETAVTFLHNLLDCNNNWVLACRPCHKIKSFAERTGLSFAAAFAEKRAIADMKTMSKENVIAFCINNGYNERSLRTAKARRVALSEIYSKESE